MIDLTQYDKKTRSALAHAFYARTSDKYASIIESCIENTTRYGEADKVVAPAKFDGYNIYLVPTDTVTCLFEYADTEDGFSHQGSIKYGDCENLILGAFGCGVFGNNPYLVADYFYDLLRDEYNKRFRNVYFPVPKSPDSKNYAAFLEGCKTYDVKVI